MPHPGSSSVLLGLSCPSPGGCWAVGAYLNGNRADVNQALHWNGRTWSLVATPDPDGTANGDLNQLWSVRCISPASCWAVGNTVKAGGVELNQALRWNGTRWSTG